MRRSEQRKERWIRAFLKEADPGNRVVILRDGTEAFPAMLKAIEEARETINLEFYKISSDSTGWAFAKSLVRKRMQGCAVRLIYDSIGSLETDPEFFSYLRSNGVQVLEFNPYVPFRSRRWGWWQRDHRKVIIIDGKTGFAGGINITDEYTSTGENSGYWRDTGLFIEGPCVRELQRLFASTWISNGGDAIISHRFFPHPEPVGDVPVRILGSKERKHRRIIRRAYIRAIKYAKESICIENAYFVPDRGILRVLRNARKRGVRVDLILPGVSDISAVLYAGRSLYARLFRWGVRIFEWQNTVLHSKIAVVDEIWSTVGSFNIDRISIVHNLEVNVTVMDRHFAAEMRTMFEQDLKHCREIDAAAWSRRPLREKILERVFYFLRRWL